MQHLSLFVGIVVELIPKCTMWDLVCINSNNGSFMFNSQSFVVVACQHSFN